MKINNDSSVYQLHARRCRHPNVILIGCDVCVCLSRDELPIRIHYTHKHTQTCELAYIMYVCDYMLCIFHGLLRCQRIAVSINCSILCCMCPGKNFMTATNERVRYLFNQTIIITTNNEHVAFHILDSTRN